MDGIEEIKGHAFENCKKLRTISTSNKKLKFLGEACFANCESLEKIVIPPSCKKIESSAFLLCESPRFTVIIEDSDEPLLCNSTFGSGNMIYIGRNIWSKEWYDSYLGKTLHRIYEGNIYWFNEVVLGDKVSEMFGGIPLNRPDAVETVQYLTIGASIKEVSDFSKDGIDIKTIRMASETPPTFLKNPYGREGKFSNRTYLHCILFVPAGSLSAYKNAPIWRNFLNIQEYETERTKAQEEHRRELERVERDREEKRIAAGKAEAERIAAKKAQEEQERRKQYAFLYEAMDKPHEHSSSKGKIPDSREYIRVKNSITEIPPDNEIWYKSEDEETIVLKNYAGQLISNTYVNGKGIYRFAEPVTVIVQAQFRNANFKSIILPQTVKRIESYGFDNCSNLRTIILSKDLQSLQTDVFCQISANIFFLGPVPKMGWRAMWNLKSNSVIYYPEAENYSSLINNFPSAPVQEKGAKMKFVSTKY